MKSGFKSSNRILGYDQLPFSLVPQNDFALVKVGVTSIIPDLLNPVRFRAFREAGSGVMAAQQEFTKPPTACSVQYKYRLHCRYNSVVQIHFAMVIG